MIFVWQGLRIEMEKIGIYCPIMQYIYYIICRYLLYENTGEDIIKKKIEGGFQGIFPTKRW